jgi:hypothetical protein
MGKALRAVVPIHTTPTHLLKASAMVWEGVDALSVLVKDVEDQSFHDILAALG